MVGFMMIFYEDMHRAMNDDIISIQWIFIGLFLMDILDYRKMRMLKKI